MKKNRIQQLADITDMGALSDTDESVLAAPENFPPVEKAVDPTAARPQLSPIGSSVRRDTDPRPQLPIASGHNILEQTDVQRACDPNLEPAIQAALIMAGFVAIKAPGFWRVQVKQASDVTAQTAGKHKRWFTGVGENAPLSSWMEEINKLYLEWHPGARPPFGG